MYVSTQEIWGLWELLQQVHAKRLQRIVTLYSHILLFLCHSLKERGVFEPTKKAIGKISKLLLLLIHGQERDLDLYNLLDVLLRDLPNHQNTWSEEDHKSKNRRLRTAESTIEAYEIYVVVRVLHHLGYFDTGFTDPIPETLFDAVIPAEEDLTHILEKKLTYIEYVNKCIHDTQL